MCWQKTVFRTRSQCRVWSMVHHTCRDLALLQQRWQGYHDPLSKPVLVLNSSIPHGSAPPHPLTEGAPPQQQSVGQQQHSSSLPHRSSGLVHVMPTLSHTDVSPLAQAAGARAQPGLQGRPISAENRAAPELSPLSAFSPIIGTPVEYYTCSAPPAAGAMPEPLWEGIGGSGFSYQAAISPGEHKPGNPLR